MAYKFRIGDLLLPVAPEKFDIEVNGNNKTINLINDGEINIIKKVGLTTANFEFLLPNVSWINSLGKEVSYPFAVYEEGYKPASYYIEQLNKMKAKLEPLTFTVIRTSPDGKSLFDTSLLMAIEDYNIKESTKNGLDIIVSIKLKEYKEYAIKSINAKGEVTTKRETINSPAPKTANKYHTIKKGDTLWGLAKYYYGDGSKYTKIANANSKIANPNLISVGQVVEIPV